MASATEYHDPHPSTEKETVIRSRPSSETKDIAVNESADYGTNNVNNSNEASSSSLPPPPIVQQQLSSRQRWFAYVKTPSFWFVLALGQILALCLTSTNTFTTLLVNENCSIPSLQTLFGYALLNAIYTPYTIYKYGFKGYLKFLAKSWWKYVLLSIFDVFGNYTAVLAYSYTTILSAQLINFWAIVVVVLISFTVLKVRYRITQIAGILLCCAGLGILLASDHLTGFNQYGASNALKGDLFMLLSASLYGLDNILQEFLVSKAPLYEVIGQLGFWGCIFNGILAGAVGHEQIRTANWTPKAGGYLIGYTLCLTIFYTGAPIMFRLASAAFFNVSLLTANFWGVIIGVNVFHYHVHYLYPIAFVCIIIGCFVYFIREREGGESFKPWLGERQEEGVDGFGTARRKVVQQEEQIQRAREGDVDA